MKVRCQSKNLNGEVGVQVTLIQVVDQAATTQFGTSTIQLQVSRDQAKFYEVGDIYTMALTPVK